MADPAVIHDAQQRWQNTSLRGVQRGEGGIKEHVNNPHGHSLSTERDKLIDCLQSEQVIHVDTGGKFASSVSLPQSGEGRWVTLIL